MFTFQRIEISNHGNGIERCMYIIGFQVYTSAKPKGHLVQGVY